MTTSENDDVCRTTAELSKFGQPLVIKGVEKIEALNIKIDKRRTVHVYTHTFSRLLRRDFNVTSVKLFWRVVHKQSMGEVRRNLTRLRHEVDALTELAHSYGKPSTAPAATCTFRIVTRESEEMLDLVLLADQALLKLEHSPLSEVATENLAPFYYRYGSLRRPLFEPYSDKQSTEA